MEGMSLPFRSFRVSLALGALFRGYCVLTGLSVATWMADAMGRAAARALCLVVEASDGESFLETSVHGKPWGR
jgi:ABC-type spermidine/putrescine transport system permease subunit I